MNGPNLPTILRNGLPHSGHFISKSLGFSISTSLIVPSSVRSKLLVKSHSGYAGQPRNSPAFPNRMTSFSFLHFGHLIFVGSNGFFPLDVPLKATKSSEKLL